MRKYKKMDLAELIDTFDQSDGVAHGHRSGHDDCFRPCWRTSFSVARCLRGFTFAMIFGGLIGTCSSIAIAAPVVSTPSAYRATESGNNSSRPAEEVRRTYQERPVKHRPQASRLTGATARSDYGDGRLLAGQQLCLSKRSGDRICRRRASVSTLVGRSDRRCHGGVTCRSGRRGGRTFDFLLIGSGEALCAAYRASAKVCGSMWAISGRDGDPGGLPGPATMMLAENRRRCRSALVARSRLLEALTGNLALAAATPGRTIPSVALVAPVSTSDPVTPSTEQRRRRRRGNPAREDHHGCRPASLRHPAVVAGFVLRRRFW